jgi:hypothetical protein
MINRHAVNSKQFTNFIEGGSAVCGTKVFTLGSVVILTVVVAISLTVGRNLSLWRCSSVVSVACAISVILAMSALFRCGASSKGRTSERVTGGALLVYIVIAEGTEQFPFVDGSPPGISVAACWLVPAVLGALLLPCYGCWLTGVGCWSLLFGAIVALGYNTSHPLGHSGVGLFHVWLE